MTGSSSISSSSDDYESNDYELINNVVTQMNVVFNPQAIGACLNVIFDEEENQSQEASSSSRPKLTRRFFHKGPTDASGRPDFNIFQKCTSAIRQLAYSFKADALDEYLQMAQDMGYQCLNAFCKCVIQLYRDEYLRKPTEADIERLTAKHAEVHGFPDRAPKVEFSVNGEQFQKGYYLADGIYPEWATLVKSFKCPLDPKTTKFKRYQEAARKDVERAFGVLQGRWQIIEQYAQPYSTNKIKRIMLCCVILHNMIVEDNEHAITEFKEELIANTRLPTRTWTERCSTQLRMYMELCDRRAHHQLRNALIEHVWNLPEHGCQR
uniref:uncharacterized protein LOC122601443 n=1 Tax=Erigeron canadensis TaxID=72917 RepID=UPI001CB900C9|nr:uncharacterized protein LOC122601443 [Erigeron canadensis]